MNCLCGKLSMKASKYEVRTVRRASWRTSALHHKPGNKPNMSESAEARPVELPTDYLAWRAKLTKRLAGYMAALISYEKSEKEKTSDHEYALRRKKTKTARAKLQGVSKIMYDWSSMTTDSKRILFAEIDETLEDAKKEVSLVLQSTAKKTKGAKA